MRPQQPEFSWIPKVQWASVVFFLVVIFLPIIDGCFHFSPKGLLEEKRTRADYPKMSDWDTHGFELAYNDRFGFRDVLVYGHNWVKTFLFHVSPTAGAIIGRDHWLYYRASINDYRGILPFPASEIEQWRREFAAKSAYFEQRNIRYIVAIAPSKESIYPEFLPGEIEQLHNRSRLDQMLEALAKKTPCEILDLRKPLLAAKAANRELIFCQTDTHWNQSGALIAATEIVDHLRSRLPELPAIGSGDYEKVTKRRPGGDLALMIGFPNAFRENEIHLIPKKPAPVGVPNGAWTAGVPSFVKTFECSGADRLQNGVLASDSFGIAVAPLLAAQFHRFTFIRHLPIGRDFHAMIPGVVEAEHPNVFIDLFTERNLAPAPKSIFDGSK